MVNVFFFKQKTADEMRIIDWSSDVCSSDLCPLYTPLEFNIEIQDRQHATVCRSSSVEIRRPSADRLLMRHADPPLSGLKPISAGSGSEICSDASDVRSEEHTSELQSLMRTSYAVFCLKKQKSQQLPH